MIEPGLVGTDLVLEPPEEQAKLQHQLKMLKAEDVAETIYWAITQPKRADAILIQIRPHAQII